MSKNSSVKTPANKARRAARQAALAKKREKAQLLGSKTVKGTARRKRRLAAGISKIVAMVPGRKIIDQQVREAKKIVSTPVDNQE